MAFTTILTLASALFALACGAFFAFLHHVRADSAVWQGSAVFVLAQLGLFLWYLMTMRSRMMAILERLSSTVQSLIDGGGPEAFPAAEDSMLSKLQDQVLKLSRILSSQKSRSEAEGREIKSLITDITHQLRAPLANLGMYGGLLEDGRLSPEKRAEFTRVIRDQTEKLAWLTDSLVQLSRLESGLIEIRPKRGAISDAVMAAMKTVYPAADLKKVEMQFAGRQDVELSYDAKWTGEAIRNVLDNAVKYTPAGGRIGISIELYELFVRIDVADSGRGVPEQERPKIFQRFFRGASSADTEGIGIGLYLARKILTEQGGYMKVESEEGKGSVFSIFLPVERDPTG
ncbi:His Kinase A (phospho-acceptor) domain-containing protein [Paenibacillus sp. RU4T]|uniref:sensor histidine kinase n=1 Tax=unclassified Paenibacillus TaxID=185978 RepID=UPI000954EC9B|nr:MULTISPECIES: HAMP domain-containing sensor histidine kinase [unclassified Paenibacillus]SIR29701.1 His Kinase A (phospho-acceptor) domain-containing protein [Paenibacillus sp. RU4X]SIR41723.1 His Kinase A (phospho-acceptor) domain-containing protein [Paenibacillus sp. RU4T]